MIDCGDRTFSELGKAEDSDRATAATLECKHSFCSPYEIKMAFPFWILDFRLEEGGTARRTSLLIWQSKSKIQNGIGGAERTRTVIVFLDREVHTPFCHGPVIDLKFQISNSKLKSWVERRDLNPHGPHSQCGALPVKLSPTQIVGVLGETRDIASPPKPGDKSEATLFSELHLAVAGIEPATSCVLGQVL